MRVVVMAAVAVLGLTALPATVRAAPTAPHGVALSTPPIELVAGGCGAGWHPAKWRDRWGNWHRRCVPNRW